MKGDDAFSINGWGVRGGIPHPSRNLTINARGCSCVVFLPVPVAIGGGARSKVTPFEELLKGAHRYSINNSRKEGVGGENVHPPPDKILLTPLPVPFTLHTYQKYI